MTLTSIHTLMLNEEERAEIVKAIEGLWNYRHRFGNFPMVLLRLADKLEPIETKEPE